MTSTRLLFKPWLLLGVVFLIVIDLWSKAWAFDSVRLFMPAEPIFGEWLSIYCITNAGGIWGVGGDGGFTVALTLIRIIAVAFLIISSKGNTRKTRLVLSL